MNVNISGTFFSDDTSDYEKDCIFIKSQNNLKYLDNKTLEDIEKIAKNIIPSYELKNYIDLKKIKIIGITGTNGKTTTASLIHHLLQKSGFKSALQGTRGFFINKEKIKSYSLTTPTQLENFANISTALDKSCDFFVMEVSSHALAQNRIEGLEFALKILSNITQDHLDYHKTLEEYRRVKNSFFQDESLKLINADDKYAKYCKKNAFTYAIENNADFKIKSFALKPKLEARLISKNEDIIFHSSLLGIFNIYNQISALAGVSLFSKKSLKELGEFLDDFGVLAGRMEVISKNPLIIVDFAHTPDGLEQVFKSFENKNIIALFGAGGDRDKSKRKIMGELASKYCKKIFLTNDNPRFEDEKSILEDIASGIKNKDILDITPNRKEAIKKAYESMNKDKDVLLILGKGDESFELLKGKKIIQKDKDIIKKLLI